MKNITCNVTEISRMGGVTSLNIKGSGINAELKLNTDIENIKNNQSYFGTLKLRDRKTLPRLDGLRLPADPAGS